MTDPLRFELTPTDRRRLRTALDHTRGFLGIAGLGAEQRHDDALRDALDATPHDATDVVSLPPEVAVRGASALLAYRNDLLDDGDVAHAADLEETLRRLADQEPRLGETLQR